MIFVKVAVRLLTPLQKKEGMEAVREILEKHSDDDMKNIFILELLELILSQNIFEFDEKLYRQEIGTSMGGKPAPDYANIFMAKLDSQIMQLRYWNNAKDWMNLFCHRIVEENRNM